MRGPRKATPRRHVFTPDEALRLALLALADEISREADIGFAELRSLEKRTTKGLH